MDLASSMQVLCRKLGIKTSCVSKAMEFHELLDTRVNATSLSALRLSGSCKLVVCLDLAARNIGITPTMTDVVRLSGMTKKSYTEAYKVVAALLEIEDRTSLRELAVQFGCPRVVPQAADILQRYTKDQCCDIDFSSPMFLCAALLVAARNEKLKIDTKKLKDRAGAKKSTFDHLVGDLQEYAIDTASREKRKSITRKRGGLMEAIDAQIQEDDRAAKSARLDEESEEKKEHKKLVGDTDYEAWKKKILDKAAKSKS